MKTEDAIEPDIFDFKQWVTENNLSQTTLDTLVKEQLNTEETFSLLTEVYVEKIRQKYHLYHGITTPF